MFYGRLFTSAVPNDPTPLAQCPDAYGQPVHSLIKKGQEDHRQSRTCIILEPQHAYLYRGGGGGG